MGRPAKSVNSLQKNLTQAEKSAREEMEKNLRGKSNKLKPPAYLTKPQKKIFKYIISELDESKLLGNLDVFILAKTAVTIDQLQTFDRQSNENTSLLLDVPFRMGRAEATKDFFRCCNELCLSPQSRAKLSISALKNEGEPKTLLDLINEDDE